MKSVRVIVGPLFMARQYVRSRRLKPDEYVIVTDATQVHHLDPFYITVFVRLEGAARFMTRRVVAHINEEISSITRLWTIPVLTERSRAVRRGPVGHTL